MAAMTETHRKLLKARAVLALSQELGRQPTGLLLRVLLKAVVGSATPRSRRHLRPSPQPSKGERPC